MRSLTIATIRKKYPDEWVLLGDPIMKDMEVMGGHVLLYHKDKKELTIQGRALIEGFSDYRVIYTGNLPGIYRLGATFLQKC